MKVNILRSLTFVFSLSLCQLSTAAENLPKEPACTADCSQSNFGYSISMGLSNYQNPLITKDDLKIPFFPSISWSNKKNFYIKNFDMGYLFAAYNNSVIEIVGKVNKDGLYHLDSKKGFIPPLVINPNPNPNEPIFIGPDDPNMSYMAGVKYSHLLNQDKELITTALYTDVSGQHHGQQMDLTWTHMWSRSKFKLASEVSMHYKSTDLLEYYYGGPLTGGQVSSSLKIDMAYQLNENWMAVVNISREFLSDAIMSSELVEVSHIDSVFAGVTWKW